MIVEMGLMEQLIYLLVKGLAILLVLQESAGSSIAPSPSLQQIIFGSISPVREGMLHPISHRMQSRRKTPNSASQPNVQPLKLAPAPLLSENLAASVSPTTPILRPINSAAPPRNFQGHLPSLSPSTSHRKPPHTEGPKLALEDPVPGVSTISTSPPSFIWKGDETPVGTSLSAMPKQVSPLDSPTKAPVQLFQKGAANPPRAFIKIKLPPHAELQSPTPSPSIPIYRRYHPRNKITIPAPLLSPVYPPASTDKELDLASVSIRPQSFEPKKEEMPVAASIKAIPEQLLQMDHYLSEEPGVSPISSPSLGFDRKKATATVSVRSNGTAKQLLLQGHIPVKAPMQDPPKGFAKSPTMSVTKSPPRKWFQPPTPLPSTPYYKNGHTKENISSSSLSSFLVPSDSKNKVIAEAPSYPPEVYSNSRHRRHTTKILHPVPPSNYHFTSMENNRSPLSPTQVPPSQQMTIPSFPPRDTPSEYSSSRNPMLPHLPHIQALPPPNKDCPSLSCREPFTNNPPGSPCGCILAMQVGLRLGLPLYAFFPLVSDFVAKVSHGVIVQQSQVRITGANADREDQEKTIVLFDLVPFGAKFDNFTAYLIYQRFWNKQMVVNPDYFRNYEVLYMRYPGLPASPPAPSTFDGQVFSAQGNKRRPSKPLGADISRQQHKKGLKGSVIAVIVLLASVSLILCCAVAWVLLFRYRHSDSQQKQAPATTLPSLAKSEGFAASKIGSGLSSISPSYNSGLNPCNGTAKTFNAIDIERATDSFDASRILGEGGFGIVYSGVLDDETKVAVKVLKRDNQQGGREFLAEIEMLSRLHHRNLVKLLGICMEEHARCLVYELVPNGSVESHLHGVDNEDAPLDWNARLKIALGAARGLAYLHEDSSPRVIHRDFKSSNILLQHDFTPKVSDFGLARTGSDEEGKHISTRVMGTFGYVAPEYAMTGHLLVKSDVYSYGVVLLELLTGRKPVDMSRPTGQENLVTWARPLLSNKEGLELVMDQSLRPEFQFESIAKVAAIASMCVQPEVTDRPFMSEVVQALKLICNECSATNNLIYSTEDASFNFEARSSTSSGYMPYNLQMQSPGSDVEWGLRASEVFSASARFGSMHIRSLRRHSSPGPSRSRKVMPLLQRMRRWSAGSKSEHGATFW